LVFGVERGRGVRDVERMNDEGRRMNVAPDLLFQVQFGSLEDAGGEIQDGFPTFISIVFLPAVPSHFHAGFSCTEFHTARDQKTAKNTISNFISAVF
jgi:hypothetical protein